MVCFLPFWNILERLIVWYFYWCNLGSHPSEEPTSPLHPKGGSPNKKKNCVIPNSALHKYYPNQSHKKYSRPDGVFFPQLPIWDIEWLSRFWHRTLISYLDVEVARLDGVFFRVLICLRPVRIFLFSCEVRLNCVVSRLSSWSEIILHLSTHVLKAPGISR